MCHVNLQKKETDHHIQILQNRLELLKRQEKQIQRATSQGIRQNYRLK